MIAVVNYDLLVAVRYLAVLREIRLTAPFKAYIRNNLNVLGITIWNIILHANQALWNKSWLKYSLTKPNEEYY
jgi:hypothetical protein